MLVFHLYLDSIRSSARWNVPGALLRPKGIILYCNDPAWETDPVFAQSSWQIGIFQYL